MGLWENAVGNIKADFEAEKARRNPPNGVIITGIRIPFFSLVGLLVKVSIALVPAAIIVVVFWIFLARTFIGR